MAASRCARLVLVLALAGCSAKAKDACKRVQERLTPSPTEAFIDDCARKYEEDPAYARMVECLLAVEGGVYEKDIERCGGKDRLPLYFQF